MDEEKLDEFKKDFSLLMLGKIECYQIDVNKKQTLINKVFMTIHFHFSIDILYSRTTY